MRSTWTTIWDFIEDGFYVGFTVDNVPHCIKCGFQRYGNCVRALYENGTDRFRLVEYTDFDSHCVCCHEKLYRAPVR